MTVRELAMRLKEMYENSSNEKTTIRLMKLVAYS